MLRRYFFSEITARKIEYLLPIAFCTVTACAPDNSAVNGTPSSVTRDSAGIHIVESYTPRWNDRTMWQVDTLPKFDVGGSLRDTSRQFSGIRGVHRFRNGLIAVLDMGSYSLRFFDSLGVPIGHAGRQGTGPGEFTSTYMPRSFSCGTDTTYVEKLGDIMVFAVPGGFARQFTPQPPVGRFPSVLGCSGERWVGWTQTAPPVRSAGVHRMPGTLAWYDLSGAAHGIIGSFPMEDQTYALGAEGWGYRPSPFGRRFVFAMGPRGIATGIGDSFEIELRDSDGALRQILRAPGLQQPLVQADIDRFRNFVLPRTTGQSKTIDVELTAENLPPTMPAFAAMRFDALGNLWVREYDFADATVYHDRPRTVAAMRTGQREITVRIRRWHVFDVEGSLLGQVDLPPRFDVHEIGADWLLGVWRNELDVEHVRMYRLRKPS